MTTISAAMVQKIIREQADAEHDASKLAAFNALFTNDPTKQKDFEQLARNHKFAHDVLIGLNNSIAYLSVYEVPDEKP